jgi:hypothetical protein
MRPGSGPSNQTEKYRPATGLKRSPQFGESSVAAHSPYAATLSELTEKGVGPLSLNIAAVSLYTTCSFVPSLFLSLLLRSFSAQSCSQLTALIDFVGRPA